MAGIVALLHIAILLSSLLWSLGELSPQCLAGSSARSCCSAPGRGLEGSPEELEALVQLLWLCLPDFPLRSPRFWVSGENSSWL